MLTTPLKLAIEEVLTHQTGRGETITRTQTTGGGCINESFLAYTNSGCWFVKCNSEQKYPGMFAAESRGLNLLRSTKTVSVPEVIGSGISGDISFLILEAVIPGKRTRDYHERLGRQLAELHKKTSETFGLDHNNYIGSLPQQNNQHLSGVNFFIRERLMPQVSLAAKGGYFSEKELAAFERLHEKLPSLLPDEKPSLLHGDLWNGNVIMGADGQAWLIDPAVNFGHRETDLAMTRLFGGFDEEFYESYNETLPLAAGWEERVELFQLYPLLVHVNLFGIGYKPGISTTLRKYQILF